MYAIEPAGTSEQSSGGIAWWEIAMAAVVLVAVSHAIYASNRPRVLAAAALYIPRPVGASSERTTGMTTTSDDVRVACATTGNGPHRILDMAETDWDQCVSQRWSSTPATTRPGRSKAVVSSRP